ncbi:senescence-associated protein-domain-containing protein [Gaertneriomyces semiglobifer]|nr:senescence-associated protein-domain-containing protein [Gaertneriomyces semiglobifer]
MAELIFENVICSILPPNAPTASASPLSSGRLAVSQDPKTGNTILTASLWQLTVPQTCHLQKMAGAYWIHLDESAVFSSLSIDGPASDYVVPRGAAILKVAFDNHAGQNELAIFESLFVPGTGRAPPTPAREPTLNQHPTNTLAVVDEGGEVVGVVADSLQFESQPVDYPQDEPVVIELDSLPVVPVPGEPQQPGAAATTGADEPVRLRVLSQTSTTLVTASDYISTGILATSSTLSNLLTTGSEKLKFLLPVSAQPWTPSPSTQRNLDKFNNATSKTAEYTRKAADTVASVAVKTGKTIAVSASKMMPPSTSQSVSQSRTANASWDMLKATIHAVSTILDSSVQAGKEIFDSSVSATSNLVSHRYGPRAGEAVTKTLGGVGNVALIYFDAKGIGRRAFIKHAAKGALNIKLKDGRVVSLGERAGQGKVAVAATAAPGQKGQVPVLTNVQPK